MADQVHAPWLSTDVAQQLTADLVAHARQQYRIGEDEAQAIVLEVLAGQQAVRAAVSSGQTAQQIERTRVFKDLATATRKRIYYHLRRYDRANADAAAALARLEAMPPGEMPGDDLLATLATGHVSTTERLPRLAEFHECLFEAIGAPASVLDVGCGLYPLLFPFDAEGASVETYVAADKDPEAVRILERYAQVRADGRLVVVPFDISDGWQALRDRAGRAHFDVAFLFKLVPVLRRQDAGAYQALTAVPADLAVLTGATTSMTKNRSIARRERASIMAFAEAAGLTVNSQAICGDEFLAVASRGGAAAPAGH